MPIVGGLILAGVLIGVVIVLSKRAEATALPARGAEYDMPPLDVSDGAAYADTSEDDTTILPPGEAQTPSRAPIPPEVAVAVEEIKHAKEAGKTPSPEVVAEGVEAAKAANMPETADKLAQELDKTMTEKIPALVAAADVPGTTIPIDKNSGKKLWFIDVRGKQKMAIPNYPSQLQAFKALQKAIGGVKADGRIGPGTLNAFVAKMDLLGFTRYPATVEALAANAVKWTEVLKKHFQPGQVGRPFDVPSRQWREFVARVNLDWDKLAPTVREKLGKYIGTEIDGQVVSLSGLCGLVNRAGMRGAEKWLGSADDRVKFPATTRAFQVTNGIF